MKTIYYILENNLESRVRLADALLYDSLTHALGEDAFCSFDERQSSDRPEIFWGRDRFRRDTRRKAMASAPYAHPAVQASLGIAGIFSHDAAQAEMDRIGGLGQGVIVRDARDPHERMRHLVPGSRLENLGFRVDRSDRSQVFTVQPDTVDGPVRRFAIVAGKIAAETPVTHHEDERRVTIGAADLVTLQANDIFAILKPANVSWRDAQADAALALLAAYPMATGAIDVGLVLSGGSVLGQVQAVMAAPPGGFDTYWMDPEAYAAAVACSLPEIEPGHGFGTEAVEPELSRP